MLISTGPVDCCVTTGLYWVAWSYVPVSSWKNESGPRSDAGLWHGIGKQHAYSDNGRQLLE